MCLTYTVAALREAAAESMCAVQDPDDVAPNRTVDYRDDFEAALERFCGAASQE